MRIQLEATAIGRGLGAVVPPIDLTVGGAIPVAIALETDERPLLVSLLLAGRIKADAGRILIDGRTDLDELRRRTALVDTPVVSEPSAGIALRTVVAEEFSFAGRSPSRRSVRGFLVENGLEEYSGLPIRALPPVERIRLFSELAMLRKDVALLIVTAPERHGGAPTDWYPPLAAIADRGVAVAIVTDFATAGILVSLGARDGAVPELQWDPEPEPAPEPMPEPDSTHAPEPALHPAPEPKPEPKPKPKPKPSDSPES